MGFGVASVDKGAKVLWVREMLKEKDGKGGPKSGKKDAEQKGFVSLRSGLKFNQALELWIGRACESRDRVADNREPDEQAEAAKQCAFKTNKQKKSDVLPGLKVDATRSNVRAKSPKYEKKPARRGGSGR